MSRAIRFAVPVAIVVLAVAAWGAASASSSVQDSTAAPSGDPEVLGTASATSTATLDEPAPFEVAHASKAWEQSIVQCLVEVRGQQWVVVKFGKYAEPVRVGPIRASEIQLQDTPGADCQSLVNATA